MPDNRPWHRRHGQTIDLWIKTVGVLLLFTIAVLIIIKLWP